MGANSKISWTDHTFNPWWGCVEASPACDHCYARTFSKRVGFDLWGNDASRRFFGDAHWNEPLKWNRQAAERGVREFVFCASMADVGEQRPDLVEPRARLHGLIDATPNLIWLLLTKRTRGLLATLPTEWRDNPRANVMFGFTADDQTWFERRLEDFIKIPSINPGFISFEPLLGRVTPGPLLPLNLRWWFLVGGESGHGARPMHPAWARELRDFAVANGIPYHFKQWGEWLPGQNLPHPSQAFGLAQWQDGFVGVRQPQPSRPNDYATWSPSGDVRLGLYPPFQPSAFALKVGVKAAGRLLDGREWLEMPEVHA